MGLNTDWITPLMKQSWVVSTVLFILLAQGMALGFTSSLLPALQDPESPIQLDLDTSSWLVASVAIAGFTSCFILPYAMATFGRRKATMIGVLPGIVACILTSSASNVSALIAGRFLNGITIGATGILGAIVIGEYTSPAYRGVFLNLKTAMLSVGVTIVHVLGNFLHWRTVSLINAAPYAVGFFLAYTWPDSPAWLAEKRDFDGCIKAFYWLRGNTLASTRELQNMIEAQKLRPLEKTKIISRQALTFLQKFRKKEFLKPLIISACLVILLETCGRHIFPSYALQFIHEMTKDKSQVFYYNLCIDLIITGTAFTASILVKRIKRRRILFTTGSASVIVLMSMCLYIYLQSKDILSKDSNLIPLILFAFYFVLVNLGCSPISLALLGEIFPLEHRPTGVCLAGVLASSTLVIILKITPFLLVTMKIYGTFAVFGLCMSVALFVLYFMLPETKDKTLQEIEDYFRYGKE